jgi:hypothetical protein
VENVATPETTDALPISAAPSKYWTLPVAAGFILTVNLTVCPTVEGFGLAVNDNPAINFTL